MGEEWYFIDSGYESPTYNMALDEALLQWHSKGEVPPVVRFYGWNPATLSIGYFQKIKDKIDVDAVKQRGFGLVRRLTGGRAVLHDNELTYSVIVSEQHKTMPSSVTEAYRVISQGILEGYRGLGIQADFSIPEEKLKQTGSAVCFEEPSWYELVIDGKKAAGSAQTRQKGVILQHGSIPIKIDEHTLFDMFLFPNDRVKERSRKAFSGKAISINDVLGKSVSIEEMKQVFKTGFEKGLNIKLKPYTLTQKQIEEVKELETRRYGSNDWTYYR